MNIAIAVTLAVVAACHIGAVPLINLHGLPSVAAKHTETFKFEGFQIQRRTDLNACLITRADKSKTNIETQTNTAEYRFGLADLANLNAKVHELCGSLKTLFVLDPVPTIQNSASGSLNIERTSLGTSNSTDIIGSLGQIVQSLFGVWGFPSLG